MTLQKIRTSGISKTQLPKILPYPALLPFSDKINLIRNRMIYVINHYGTFGISVLISYSNNNVIVMFGDWNGNSIDLSDASNQFVPICMKFLNNDVNIFINMMSTIKLRQAQFFLALDSNSNLTLVDVQVSVNKLSSPGMLRDIFSKLYPVQNAIKVEICDERTIESILNGTGSYGGDLIIKPSNFAVCSIQDKETPLYLEVRR